MSRGALLRMRRIHFEPNYMLQPADALKRPLRLGVF